MMKFSLGCARDLMSVGTGAARGGSGEFLMGIPRCFDDCWWENFPFPSRID